MHIKATSNMEGQRLDSALADALPQLTRRVVRDLINAGKVKVNDQVQFRPHYRVQTNDSFDVDVEDTFTARASISPMEMDLPILFANAGLVVINKPAGIPVHPTNSDQTYTVINGLHYVLRDQLTNYGVTLLHRLDRDTSGVLAVATNPEANRHYARQFAEHRVHKQYVLRVNGDWRRSNPSVVVKNSYLQYVSTERKQKVVDARTANAQFAKTEFKFSRYLPQVNQSEVLAVPLTGRTHQIRIQIAELGFPILGDIKYGGDQASRLFLHAQELAVTSPQGEVIKVVAPVPVEFVQ